MRKCPLGCGKSGSMGFEEGKGRMRKSGDV
jgi:hypothetical protein